MKRLIIAILIATLALPTLAYAAVGDWQIDGDKVFIDDENVYLSATPHTLGSSGWVEFELVSKRYEGEIDAVWGFDLAQGVKPSKPQIWAKDVPHERYRWVDVEKVGELTVTGITSFEKLDWATFEGEPDIGNRNNTHLYRVTADFRKTGETETLIVAFNSYSLYNSSADIVYNYDTQEKEYYTEYYDDWKPFNAQLSTFDRYYKGCDDWRFIKLDAPVQKNVTYKVRCWVEIPFSGMNTTQGKYIWAVKPSGESINEAISSGHLYVLDPWYNASWIYRKSLTFDNSASSENLTAFPVLVHLDDTNIDWTKVQNSGEDIRFTDSDGETLLSHEIEEWDDTNTADIWVKVPQIDLGSDTDYIWMYYGNDSAADGQDVEGTWNSNYVMVQHLQEDPSGSAPQMIDSTSNNNDGTSSGTMLTEDQIAGQIDGSLDFDGTDDYVDCPHSASLNLVDAVTAEVWIYPTNTDEAQRILGKWYVTSYAVVITADDRFDSYISNTRVLSDPGVLPEDSWHYLALTFDKDDTGGTNIGIYKGGSLVKTGDRATAMVGSVNQLAIGRCSSVAVAYFEGFIDEVRISDVARSAEWLEAQNLSMTDAYITFGSEESVPANPPINFTLTAVGSTQVDVSWTKGEGADKTMVRRKYGSYPADRTDGVQIYYNTGTSVSDYGLDTDKDVYYYRAWSQTALEAWSETYAEGKIGGGSMLALSMVIVVLGLTTLSFVRREGMLSAASIIAWLLFTFVMFNQSWPSENEYLGTAAALFGITMVIIMTVVTLNHYLGLRPPSATLRERKLAYREKVLSLTRKRKPKEPWYL